jgi:hypothetical protein
MFILFFVLLVIFSMRRRNCPHGFAQRQVIH